MHRLLTSPSFHAELRGLPRKNGVISAFYAKAEAQKSDLRNIIKRVEAAAKTPVHHGNVFSLGEHVVMTFGFEITACNADLMVYYDSRKETEEYQILHREQIEIQISSMTRLLLINGDANNLLEMHFGANASQVAKIIQAFGLRIKPVILEQLEYQENMLELERS